MKTRYRVLLNQITGEYKIQYQVFRLTIFGKHWKREWKDHFWASVYIAIFPTKEQAISKINDFKNCDIRERNQRHRMNLFKKGIKKDKKGIKKDNFLKLWIKVYP